MPLTPETLTRHELNGLNVEVVDAANPDLVGIAGRVVVETMQTIMVDDGSRVRQVPKQGATFQFEIPRTDEAADAAKVSGTTSKLRSETAGRFETSQSYRRSETHSDASRSSSENCEGVAYVTVDGARLLSRPALRTETTGDSKWR
ncbi:ribonuclease P subunit P29 [Haloferax elongans ATCC BAA-1513]|uniref:Ribonuclease P protein component 1 n=1 Tax=Haloferax elongans ATCC BAA-1513 TaxID=1230453 RepID=M0HD08_HALEO|nr:ribonuclease P protein component 1 [Haloferax elongans]ELZ82400.1 ribonuclease P subunit P29 [Haloferax elongans ATCC BAA-1513]